MGSFATDASAKRPVDRAIHARAPCKDARPGLAVGWALQELRAKHGKARPCAGHGRSHTAGRRAILARAQDLSNNRGCRAASPPAGRDSSMGERQWASFPADGGYPGLRAGRYTPPLGTWRGSCHAWANSGTVYLSTSVRRRRRLWTPSRLRCRVLRKIQTSESN